MTTPPPAGVQRYHIGGAAIIDESSEGIWVAYDAHAAALAAKEERATEAERQLSEVTAEWDAHEVIYQQALADRDRLAAENARLREAANAFMDCYRLNDTTSLSQWFPGQHCADKFRELARAVAAPQPETKGGAIPYGEKQ